MFVLWIVAAKNHTYDRAYLISVAFFAVDAFLFEVFLLYLVHNLIKVKSGLDNTE